jgi:hypothetical protein
MLKINPGRLNFKRSLIVACLLNRQFCYSGMVLWCFRFNYSNFIAGTLYQINNNMCSPNLAPSGILINC